MKLIIQIPCYNEEETLPKTLAELPREIPGVDSVEVLVIDDGSSDRTVEVARENGVEHILSFTQHRGLARAFAAGLDAAVRAGADIIVNTDADNQYHGPDIALLVAPVLRGEADIVIGDRRPGTIPHFSWMKRRLQRLGSWVVRKVSRTEVPDAASGFRAYSREAALKINVVSDFSYVLETILQAASKDLKIVSVPVRTNRVLRKSRLVSSLPNYLRRQTETILRIYAMYEPLRVFSIIGGATIIVGLALAIRFLYFFFTGQGGGHVQSVVAAGVFIILGFLILLGGLGADLVAANRKILEDTLYRVRRMEAERKKDTSQQ
ncbi:MAG: glycosyltransferase [Armatimonadetes bacterium]|nr:glycosyltransferase [Armatimonadota bacterium]NIM24070.1 glycosyltransferase [Armatimonadota bacterium]NIM67924.1 glycosyltransferase [Armatimonadota bacterium]NIM76446.1 glycosyltransferase [Armatimonadota bacterium]NIN06154.1 glycosyltransferase [Armatimonadota bacterium]